MIRDSRRTHSETAVRGGFTLVETLAVVAIIGVLISILLVALGGALTESRRTQTTTMMQAIETGVEQFKNDLGYLPPQVLGGAGWTASGEISTPSLTALTDAAYANVPAVQAVETRGSGSLSTGQFGRYQSEFTIVAYLMGIGDFNGDGNTGAGTIGLNANLAALNDGVGGPGIKSPGTTKAWKSTEDLVGASPMLTHEASPAGQTYGPYLDIGRFEPFLDLDTSANLYRILDPFDSPIRYYSGLPNRDGNDLGAEPSLLRMPPELWTAEWAAASVSAETGSGPTPLAGDDRDLLGAEYVLLSSGTDIETYRTTSNETFAFFGDIVLGDTDQPIVIDIADPVVPSASFNFTQVTGDNQQATLFLRALESNLRLTR